jgi:biopolymer transport protein ExbD
MSGGGDVAEPKKHGKGKKRKKGRRLGVRIDMTPLVDVAFLLLTFFMFTTSMSRPQTLEINLPPKDVNVEVKESNLLTLRVNEKADIYWNFGLDLPKKITFKELAAFLKDKYAGNPSVIVLMKVDRQAKYNEVVSLIDEVRVAGIPRWSMLPLADKDRELMAKAI